MNKPSLPSELRNLSPEELAAAIKFAKDNASIRLSEGLINNAEVRSQTPNFASTGQHADSLETTGAQEVLIGQPKVIAGSEVPHSSQIEANTYDIPEVLAGGPVKDPSALLEYVLNLAEKNPGDTAYKA